MAGKKPDKKNVIVTGGAGYIGAHACKALREAGFSPVAFDNLVYGHRESVQWGDFFLGDVLDPDALKQVFKKYSPIAVMHFAAYAYVGESVTNPGKYYRNNVSGSINLLEAMRDFETGFLVFSSTCATYGVPKTVPIPDDHQQNPINPYGTSKMMVEKIISDFSLAHNLKFVNLRYFNAAGADPEGRIGEEHSPETHLIPLVLDVVNGKRDSIKLFGDDYDTPDGSCIRDYIHVDDLSSAHVQALNHLLNEGKSESFNLGTGKGFSVKQVIQMVEKVAGKNIPIVVAPRREGDPPALIADASRARSVLEWKAKRSSLRTIISDAYNFTRLKGR